MQRDIPARAGNGLGPCSYTLATSGHPRACGERLGSYSDLGLCGGTSPRVRGTEAAANLQRQFGRDIPARAGNGHTALTELRTMAGHPRACGERSLRKLPKHRAGGTSPRVRGTASPLERGHAHRRDIPARAGNGSHRLDPARPSPGHPRACGEREGWKSLVVSDRGTSPRVRGTDLVDMTRPGLIRDIPARAGNGCGQSGHTCQAPGHPRACGERSDFIFHLSAGCGTSPRVRGTVTVGVDVALEERDIPARAGNGSSTACVSAEIQGHPRACGERSPASA